MSRSCRWCVTVNNYTEDDEFTCWDLANNRDVRYCVFGREVGDAGTPHLQGFVSFVTAKSFSYMQSLLPGGYFEVTRGTSPQAAEYCKKDGDWWEHGDIPTSAGERGKLGIDKRWELAKQGRFEELAPESLALYERIYLKYRPAPVLIDGPLLHEWWYGMPGTGKTSKAFRDYPDAYIKDPCERWWDGYSDEDTVIVDDFDKYQVKQSGDLKRWLDRYVISAPVKGGYLKIRPKKIIVTSNYHPRDIWPDDQVTYDAIMRRVKVVCFRLLPCGGAHNHTEHWGEHPQVEVV